MQHGTLEHAASDLEERLQQRTAVLLFGEQAQDVSKDVFERDFPQAVLQGRRDFIRDARRVDGVDSLQDDVAGDLPQPLVAAAMFVIVDEQRRHLLLTHDLHDVFDRQQVIARKRHKRIHDAAAVTTQDVRAVRNAEGLAEDGRDGEPVGKAADRRREKAVMDEASKEAAGREGSQKTGGADGQGEIRLRFFLHGQMPLEVISFRYARKGSPRSLRRRANSTVALRKPSLSPRS